MAVVPRAMAPPELNLVHSHPGRDFGLYPAQLSGAED